MESIYLLYFLIFFSGIGVVVSYNPVHSVLWLIAVFLCSGLLFFYFDEPFIALTVLIVYVGAVAVLIMFVCMLLEIKIVDFYTETQFSDYMIVSYLIFFLVIFSFFEVFTDYYLVSDYFFNLSTVYFSWINIYNSLDFMVSLSIVLYLYYGSYLILMSFLLLAGMMGAVVLTLYHRYNVKRQSVYQQVHQKVGVRLLGSVVSKQPYV
jgi:NADH-quinone oxidoreductase subunit J